MTTPESEIQETSGPATGVKAKVFSELPESNEAKS